MKAVLRNIRISPKKANLVAGVVRNKKVKDALSTLKFMPKKAAPLLAKVIKSAAANAVNNYKQKEDTLFIKEILVSKSFTLKRHIPVSRGRAHPIRKMASHITVLIGVEAPVKETPSKEVDTKETTEEVKVTKKTTTPKKTK